MSRKKHHEEHDEHVNHEAWVIPYADLLTLLMGLFLVLWSLGQTDLAKAAKVQAGFAAELGVGPAGGQLGGAAASQTAGTSDKTPEGQDVVDLRNKLSEADAIQAQAEARAADIRAEQAELKQAQQQIQAQLDARGLSDKVQMRLEPQGLIVVATDGLLFGSGSAALGDAGQRAIDIIAEPMKSLSQPIRIEGHTDNTPIATGQFPSNWELSSGRASTVLRHLVEQFGLPAGRVSAAGYADTRPVAGNDTAAGRAANRRVEIVLIATKASAPLPTGTDGVAGSTGVAGTPAPIGADGPLGAPESVIPALPKPTTVAPTEHG
jgi:chemotaxis protein MotB